MANGLLKSSASAGAGALSSAQAANSADIKTASLFNSQQKQVEEQRKLIAEYNQAQTASQDNGGFFGGIGYTFEKLGLGFLQSIEGIWDFTAGGLADLFGAHDWAEKQMANDWVNYGHADEWFNPSDGWKVAGDVAGGIGTSLPAIAAVAAAAAITYFSGGTLSPVAAGLIGGAVAGFGAAGTATKEAYKETGQLTGKEWGYGALSGFTEGAMEGVTDAIGFGVGSIAKNLAGSTAKASAKAVGTQVAKSAARQTFGKTILKSFLSEAFEEGVQELLDPVWKRITYDPNAENATFQQVAYAALIGGLSGAIMGGADVSVRNGVNYFSGSKINANGGVNGVISLAETIAETEGANQSGNAQVDFVVNTLSELQESLKSTGGEVKTAKQKMLVGMLSKANTAAPLSIVVHQNADAIIADAETTIKRLNDIGYKTSKGEAVTVEMLKQGVTGERGTTEYRKSLSTAMQTNEALRSVAVMSAAGQLNMDAARFQQSTLRGEQLFNQSDLNHFVETATDAQKRDVGERLGIADWATVTADELKSRIVEFSTNGGLDQYINERNEIKKLTELEISKKGLPKYVGSIKQDGAVRYKFGDASVAIVKNGDTYLVYDYANDVASKPLTKAEANRVIKEIYAASVQSATDSDVQTKAQQETQQLDTFARENIPDYKNLVGAQQQAVRQTLRQAKAAGVSEADQILYASVAARSGVNIEFVSAETLGANADAGYSLKDGKILVNRDMANNPKARTAAKILLHEFTHGMIHRGYAVKGKKGKQHLENKVLNDFFTTAIKGLSAEQQIEILTPYVERHGVTMQDFIDGKADISIDAYIELREELAANFVERELGNSAALQRIISDKPSFKDKLLSFLKRAKTEYGSNEKLSRAANALLNKYQKFFNKYATQNRYSPTITSDTSAYQQAEAATGERFALSTTEYEKTLDNLDSFTSVDAIKSYFADVHAMINNEYYGSPHTMAELNEQIRKRAEKVMQAVNLEKEAISQWRKKHRPKKTIDLETKAQIEAIDKRYQAAIKNNDLETARYLVEQMAIQKGYSVTDYRIDHRAPCADGSNASLDDVTSMFGEDIYSDKAAQYFGTYEGFDNESIRYIQQAKGKPNGTVIAYRAVPTSVKSDQIRNGDWITLTRQYAVNHGESNIIGNYRIIQKRVRIADVYTNGDSIHEFGYDDGKQYFYRDTVNFKKLADTITFDDDGNPIRLKDRFNYRNSDIRYALSPMTEEQYRFVSKLSTVEATQTENSRYSVYCENNSGLLEYEASGLTYEKLTKYFGGELATETTLRATETGKTVKILRDTLAPIVERYKSLSNITPDLYKRAKKEFGTTNNVQVAGYINLDGTMLDFGGGYDYRLLDHRDISTIMSDLSGTQAMNAYIAQGNIRLMPESPSIELDYQHEPTAKQYTTIRKVVDTLLAKLDNYGKFYLEFSNKDSSVESREYGRNTPTSKILSDIQYYYKNGSLPQQSELSKFRYALPATDSQGRKLTDGQREYFKDSKILDKNGNLLVVYHGTLADNLTWFDPEMVGTRYSYDERGFFFTDRESIARDYASSEFNRDKKGVVIPAYILGKKPLVIDSQYLRKNGYPRNALTENDCIGFWDIFQSAILDDYDAAKADSIVIDDGMSKMVVAFNSNQIKRVDNQNPTTSKDIRYALTSKSTDGSVYTADVEVRYALSKETLDFLNNQDGVKVYRAMQLIDGELYPPMAAKVKSADGKKQLVTPSNLGEWEQSVERPDLIKNGKFELNKGNGSTITAAYNPYFHTSLSPLNDQFSSAYKRDNLVVVEGIVPSSELTSGYKAQYAKDAVGETKWHSGVVSSKLKGEKARRVILSRWFKPVRIVPDAEVAGIIAKTLSGENIEIPYNVVTPQLRQALESEGVKIRYALNETSQKRNKPIDGQMDIFRDIIGAQENTQAEAWDSDYTKQAKTNADNIIKQLKERGYEQISVAGAENDSGQGRSGTSNNGQGSRMLDFDAVRRLFEGSGVRTAQESRLYSKIVRDLNGYSIKIPFTYSSWKFGVIDDGFYTYDMLRIADVNRANGIGTVFYLEGEIYNGGKQRGTTAGLFFMGGSNVYISALLSGSGTRIPLEVKETYGGKSSYRFDYDSAWAENPKYAATRGSNNQGRVTMRHERLHLIYDAARRNSNFSQETYNAVGELKRFVEQRFAGRADDVHRSIKDYYVKELGYGKVEAAIEEIACDLYCEDLILNDKAERAEIQKLIDNIDKTLNDVVGKDGVRYALTNPDTDPDIDPTESDNSGAIGGLTRGQRAKFVANNTKFKVYSKLDATSVIDSIIAERLTLRDGQYEGVLSGKSRAEVIEKLFTKLNSTPEGYRIGVALNIADYIIDNAVLSDMYETYNDNSYAMGVLSVMRRYMHSMNLSGIQSEIQYKFDKKNSINLVWGAKTDGISPDVVAQELESYGIHIEAINEAEQFFEMLEIYEDAKEQVNKQVEKIKLTAIGSKTEVEQLRQAIARDVLLAYDKKGTPSKYAKLVEKYTNKISDLKKDLSTAYKCNTLVNRIVDGAAYLRDVATKRNYVGAEIFSAPELTSWLKQLAKIKYRSDLRKSGVRKILLDYGQFYNTNNALLYDENPDLSYIDNNVIDALNFIRQNALSSKPLSMEELQAAEVIIASAKHLFNNYDQIIIEGKKAQVSQLAADGNEIIKKTKNRTNATFFNKIYSVFNKIIEPRVVIKSLENFHPDGILTRAYNEITRGETEAGLLYIELTNDIDTYIKKHKRFKNRLTSEYVTIAGAELTVGQAISLYELSKRPQAQEGLYESGFSYIDKKGSKQTAHITEADITAMYDAFTDTDKGFIELVESFFNVASKQVKTDADMQILGYTNTSEEFYYPIKRDSGTIAKNITDARSIMSDWANVYNFSFNKDVRTGAKNKLFVTDVYSIVTRHAKQLSTYAKMTVPLKNFSQIYAKNIGDKTNVVSIRNTINEQVWGGAEGYLSKLFSDIQGRATSNSIIEKMRGAYAKYQLGANLKVIISQVTSYPTAGIMLDTGVMAKGFVMKTNWAAMDKYCPYARVRNYERGIVKAEGVIDKIGKVGDVLTKPIQWTDRFTIGRLWNACQLQVQKNTGLKYGTVENMQQAGVMLEEVIRLTQPNYTNTERSELMRSDSDIVRSFTMFTSVPLKQLSRLVESFGEFNALRSLIKSGDTDATLAKRYKLAKKKLRRTLASVTIANLMYVLVGQFFKFLYNNMAEDDEGKVTAESVFIDMLKDFGSTTIGMLPVVRDVYGYFVNGYEINSFTGDMINSIIGSAKSLFELAQKAASGEQVSTQEYMSIFRNSLYSIGQVTGIPFRNINNTITGLIKRFSPSAAYSYTSLFYNHKYSTDIKAALKKGDYELAETIMGMMLKDDRTGGLNSKATQKLIELYDAGYTVLPKSIGDTLTYNGETIQLTATQRSAFRTIYSQANAEIEKLVDSANFATLPAERQAKAIKLLYDAYYSKAQASVLKVPTDNKIIMLSSAITPSALAPHLAAISAIESDTDKKGNVINGSKKAKIIKYVMAQKLTTAQKLLLILALGYTIKDGDIRGVSAAKAKSTVARYITNLSLSKAEKTALAEKCGLMVKNGRIYAR